MTELKRVPVQAYQVRLYCECGGEMTFTGSVKPMHPLLYEHKCVKCGNRNSPQTKYPTIEHEEI